MLLSLLVVITFTAPDLESVETAYAQWLDYEVVARGQVKEDMATAWDAPATEDRNYIVLQPASDAPYYLRFVEGESIDGYVPMQSFGWNATELLVQDPDALAAQLRSQQAPFRIVGEPRPLSPTSDIRAMQVVGPANEVLYLTRIPPGTDNDAGAPRHSARTFVDRPFIVILSGPDIDGLRDFYQDTFNVPVTEPFQARMTVLNKAMGLDIETTHPLAMARFSSEFSIELDEYPPEAVERPNKPGELPQAMAAVSFEVEDLDDFADKWIAEPIIANESPYDGRRIVFIRGAFGELIELIQIDD